MDKERLELRIKSVIEKEFDDILHSRTCYSLITSDTEKIIKYEHSDTLIDIFSNIQSNTELKELFILVLEKDLIFTDSSLSFYTLVKLKFTDKALNMLSERQRAGTTYGDNIFAIVNCMLQEKYTYFDFKELHRLIDILKLLQCSRLYLPIKSIVLSKVRKTTYEITKKSIKEVNIEINRDKKEVENIIRYLELDEKYNTLLNEIDKFINTESAILSAGMIGNLRAFMEQLLTDLAKKIAFLQREDIPKYEGIGEMGRVRRYLKINLELSDDDNGLIDAFIGVLHGEGGHSFVSNKDYFRLARNIGIEIVLLLLSKYKSKYTKQVS